MGNIYGKALISSEVTGNCYVMRLHSDHTVNAIYVATVATKYQSVILQNETRRA